MNETCYNGVLLDTKNDRLFNRAIMRIEELKQDIFAAKRVNTRKFFAEDEVGTVVIQTSIDFNRILICQLERKPRIFIFGIYNINARAFENPKAEDLITIFTKTTIWVSRIIDRACENLIKEKKCNYSSIKNNTVLTLWKQYVSDTKAYTESYNGLAHFDLISKVIKGEGDNQNVQIKVKTPAGLQRELKSKEPFSVKEEDKEDYSDLY